MEEMTAFLDRLRSVVDSATETGNALFELKTAIMVHSARLNGDVTLEAAKLAVASALRIDRCPQPCAQGISLLETLVTARGGLEASPPSVANFVNAILFPVVDLLMETASESASTACHLKRLLHRIYFSLPAAQEAVREAIMVKLAEYLDDPLDSRYFGVDALLQTLNPIISGLSCPLRTLSTKSILLRCLAPLALSPKGNALTGQSETEFYSASLSRCVSLFISRLAPEEVADYVTKFFLTLLSSFAKQKLLPAVGIMSVLERVIDELDGESFSAVHVQLFGVIAHACSSDYLPLVSRGLRVWQNEGFVMLCQRWPDDALSKILPALWRHDRGYVDGAVAVQLLVAMNTLARLEPADAHESRLAGLFSSAAANGDEGMGHLRSRLEDVALRFKESEDTISQEKRRRLADPSLRVSVARAATKRLDFVFGRVLGFGAYAVVKYAKMIETTIPQNLWFDCAVKLISKKAIEQQDCAAAVAREVTVQRLLSEQLGGLSGGIVPVWHSFADDHYFCLVSPFCRRGDVFDAALGDRDGSSCFSSHPAWITYVIFRVGTILVDVHKAGYYYGDLKPENVLIYDDDEHGMGIALTDFGACMSASELSSALRLGGTVDYLAPELLLQIASASSNGGDVRASVVEAWAFGVFCAYLITGKLPFPAEESISAQIRRVSCGAEETYCSSLPTFVRELLEPNPQLRLSISAALGDAFFESSRAVTKMPEVPPRLRAAAVAPATNAGRKESMMWKQVHIAQFIQQASPEATGGDGQQNIDLKEVSVPTAHVVALLPRTTSARSGPSPAAGKRSIPGYGEAAAKVSEFFTVMPRKF